MTDDEILAALDYAVFGKHDVFFHVTITCGCEFIWDEWYAIHVAVYFLDQFGICFECGQHPARVWKVRALD